MVVVYTCTNMWRISHGGGVYGGGGGGGGGVGIRCGRVLSVAYHIMYSRLGADALLIIHYNNMMYIIIYYMSVRVCSVGSIC